MSNEAIGIGCVFALTFFLFMLRHLYLSIGRRDKSRQVRPAAVANKNLNDESADDAWLLWTPKTDDSDSSLFDDSSELRLQAKRRGGARLE